MFMIICFLASFLLVGSVGVISHYVNVIRQKHYLNEIQDKIDNAEDKEFIISGYSYKKNKKVCDVCGEKLHNFIYNTIIDKLTKKEKVIYYRHCLLCRDNN